MRKAEVYVHDILAAFLVETDSKEYELNYLETYQGPPVSLTLPISQRQYDFEKFPAFFDGVLPEGPLLEALLRRAKLDRDDYFSQIVTVGSDLVGAVTVKEFCE